MYGLASTDKLFQAYTSLYWKDHYPTSEDRYLLGSFKDLSKAFDTIDHEILFTKLEQHGIRDVALQWIKSYFSYRYQFVQFNQTCSPIDADH